MSQYQVLTHPSAFESAMEAFAALASRVHAADSASVDHAEMERRIAVEGREPLRLLLQGWATPAPQRQHGGTSSAPTAATARTTAAR